LQAWMVIPFLVFMEILPPPILPRKESKPAVEEGERLVVKPELRERSEFALKEIGTKPSSWSLGLSYVAPLAVNL
jgi:hypothetical protein